MKKAKAVLLILITILVLSGCTNAAITSVNDANSENPAVQNESGNTGSKQSSNSFLEEIFKPHEIEEGDDADDQKETTTNSDSTPTETPVENTPTPEPTPEPVVETPAPQEPTEPEEETGPIVIESNSTNANNIISYGRDVIIKNNANQRGYIKIDNADLILEDYALVTGYIRISNGDLSVGKKVWIKGAVTVYDGNVEVYYWSKFYRDLKITSGNLKADDRNEFENITISGGNCTLDDYNKVYGNLYDSYGKVWLGRSNVVYGNITARIFSQTGDNDLRGDYPE